MDLNAAPARVAALYEPAVWELQGDLGLIERDSDGAGASSAATSALEAYSKALDGWAVLASEVGAIVRSSSSAAGGADTSDTDTAALGAGTRVLLAKQGP